MAGIGYEVNMDGSSDNSHFYAFVFFYKLSFSEKKKSLRDRLGYRRLFFRTFGAAFDNNPIASR